MDYKTSGVLPFKNSSEFFKFFRALKLMGEVISLKIVPIVLESKERNLRNAKHIKLFWPIYYYKCSQDWITGSQSSLVMDQFGSSICFIGHL